VTVAQQNDAAVAEAGEQVYRRLRDAGVDALIDDRPARAGEKFSDAELVGIPLRITIGKRGLASGTAEVTERATGETVAVPLDEIPEHVRKLTSRGI
jgi:prolyl-tRNA synthetase